MPISVLGMHRSGTSMVTSMLASLGIELGPDEEMLPASDENPAGYFERHAVMRVNEKLLDVLEGAWDLPPDLEPGWELDPALDHLRPLAREALHVFDGAAQWGWKDPRMSLLLPFWEREIGERTKVLVCLRNPIDVARSLEHRGSMSYRLAADLWERYTLAALDKLEGRIGCVTHFDSFFEAPEEELRRIVDALELEAAPSDIRRAAGRAQPRYRHSMTGLGTLIGSRMVNRVVATYIDTCKLAGDVYERIAARDSILWDDEAQVQSGASTEELVRAFRAGEDVPGMQPTQAGAGEEDANVVTTSVIVPLYGNLALTQDCLEALQATLTRRGDVEVVLVDSASPDATREWLESLHADQPNAGNRLRVRTVLLDENRNFSGACRAGADVAAGDRLVFLNNDTIPHPGWLEPLEAALEDPQNGVVGCLLLYPDGTVQHGGVVVPGERGLPEHVHAGATLTAAPTVLRARELQAVTAACTAIRRSVWRALDGFATTFVNGMEDVDLCFRARAAGYRVWYEPASVVTHHESKSDGRFAHARANIERFLAESGTLLFPDDHAQDVSVAPQLPAGGHDVPGTVIAATGGDVNRVLCAVPGDSGWVRVGMEGADATRVDALLDAHASWHDERVIVVGRGWVEGMAVPARAIAAVGGFDLRLPADVQLSDFLDRCRLWGWRIDDHSAGGLPTSSPWYSSRAADPQPDAEPGAEPDPVLRSRWGRVLPQHRARATYVPLSWEPALDVEAHLDPRAVSYLVTWQGDEHRYRRSLEAALAAIDADADVSLVVRVGEDEARAMELLDLVADAAETTGAGLPDIVLVQGNRSQDEALVRIVAGVVLAGTPEHERRLASLAHAAGVEAVTVDGLVAAVAGMGPTTSAVARGASVSDRQS